MRADRLLSILLLLQTKGQATTAELTKRLEVYWRKAKADFRSNIPTYRVLVQVEERVFQHTNPASHWGQVEHTEPLEDGWLKAQIRFEYQDQALGWALGAGTKVEVLEPIELKERLWSPQGGLSDFMNWSQSLEGLQNLHRCTSAAPNQTPLAPRFSPLRRRSLSPCPSPG